MCDIALEEETYGNIYHDPNFFDRFLSGPPARLDAVLKYCRKTNTYTKRGNRWTPTTRVTRRSVPEPPLLKLLNTIVRGVHSTTRPNFDTSPSLFLEQSEQNPPTRLEEYELPDYLLFDGITQGYSGVRTAVKIMRLAGHRKMGMVYLSLYAREMFFEQIHRRHIYCLMVCGTEVTFVRFDRGGILYSSAIDLFKDVETFITGLASLMMLNREDEGYDPYFSTKVDPDGQAVYYLDLPIETTESQSASDRGHSSKRKFKVEKIICHRFEIVGNATTVLRLYDVLEPTKSEVEPEKPRGKGKRKLVEPAPVEEEEQIGDTPYVVKISWRPTRGIKESETYKRVEGMYGLAQHIWACDVPRQCACPVPNEECSTCVVEIAHIEGLEVCDQLSNLVFSRDQYDPKGKDREGPELDTSVYTPTLRKREHYIYSYLLMTSVGVPVENAENPRQYMNAVLDAVLGYWRLFNLGYLHRDISDGNVFMLEPNQKFAWKEWINPSFEVSDIEDEELRRSEEKLREVIVKLDRDPVGVLVDFDLASKHSASNPITTGGEVEFHSSRKRRREESPPGPDKRQRLDLTRCFSQRDMSEPPPSDYTQEYTTDYRTGTVPFMSASSLGSTYGMPYRHSYLDDLESFYWLIYLSAVSHVDEGKTMNANQKQEVKLFDSPSMGSLAEYKSQMIMGGDGTSRWLNIFDNKWAKSFAFRTVLVELEEFFREVWEERDPGLTPTQAFTRFTDVLLIAVSN
ncbi:hypothetical protein RSOLAG1IB_10699 [Rhizoctonia solani AG-1 IB]|uniref:Fungal-type protein kinase domain-containing protein n=1 Tax=Thanatephorus cucumeris (strain AG1-IB / isolate 7/3/14) TaxID=1108050 RepID=A0A0B7FZG4_THACB|nr:hypothetical protein RSOLAG1IB_10699 [Rhizoctonia solani AG-1 IB]